MQLPCKYDDLLNDRFGLENIGTTVREVIKKEIKEEYNTTQSIEDTIDSMVDWTASEYFSDATWNSLLNDCNMFTQTFFDDIRELEISDAYDSLFAETIPYFGHWSGPPINKDDVLIKSHDCMWAGHCGSSEHKDECDKLQKLWAGYMNPPQVPATATPVQSSQQSLLKPSLRNGVGVPVVDTLLTPPISDDDENKGKKTQVEGVPPSISNAPFEIDEADQELVEYFNSKPDSFGGPQENVEENVEELEESGSEESESEEESHDQAGPSRVISPVVSNVTSVISNIRATQNDHSYFKEKTSSMIMSDLGIDTPSDSGNKPVPDVIHYHPGGSPPLCQSVKSVPEEEIDVVSVPDKKYPVANRMGYIPPTNPPLRGRRNMQRPLDSAMITGRRNINNNNNNTNNKNGVKVMLPAKRAPPAINYPPAKRRAVAPANENNKGRRTKQTRTNMTTGRRRANNNQEPQDGQPGTGKRVMHNNMERMRREDLRDAFDYLRQLVPEVLRKDRAAKVVILREAAKYCNYLTIMDQSMTQQRKELRSYQKKLKKKVSYLRTQIAIESGRINEEGEIQQAEENEEEGNEEEENEEEENEEEEEEYEVEEMEVE